MKNKYAKIAMAMAISASLILPSFQALAEENTGTAPKTNSEQMEKIRKEQQALLEKQKAEREKMVTDKKATLDKIKTEKETMTAERKALLEKQNAKDGPPPQDKGRATLYDVVGSVKTNVG